MTHTETPKEAANVSPHQNLPRHRENWSRSERNAAQGRGHLVPPPGQDRPCSCQARAQTLKTSFSIITIPQYISIFYTLNSLLRQIKDTGQSNPDGREKVQTPPREALGCFSSFKISDAAACYITTLFIMWLFTIQTKKIQKCSIWIQLNAKWWCFSWGHIPISSKTKKDCTQVETGWKLTPQFCLEMTYKCVFLLLTIKCKKGVKGKALLTGSYHMKEAIFYLGGPIYGKISKLNVITKKMKQ